MILESEKKMSLEVIFMIKFLPRERGKN